MERQSAADASKELQQLKREWKKFRLPFDSDFFGDAVEQIPLSIPIAQHPELLPPRRYREWFTPDTVLASLQKWKTMVVDDMSMRIQLMNGFITDEQTASDTLDTLRHLCFQQSSREGPSKTDAWHATAFFAAKLVHDNDRVGSPIDGMEKKGELDWCFDVMIRLLLVVYCDLLRQTNGYFEELLGGSSVEELDKISYKRHFELIDNRPISKTGEMTGLHGYNRLHRNYSWFKQIGKT